MSTNTSKYPLSKRRKRKLSDVTGTKRAKVELNDLTLLIPNELLFAVFNWLKMKTLYYCMLVCKRWLLQAKCPYLHAYRYVTMRETLQLSRLIEPVYAAIEHLTLKTARLSTLHSRQIANLIRGRHLKSLTLDNMVISSGQLTIILEPLRYIHTLTSLIIPSGFNDLKHYQYLFAVLADRPSLLHLHLGVTIWTHYFDTFERFLSSPTICLESMELCGQLYDGLCSSLAIGLSENTSLRFLKIVGGYCLKDAEFGPILSALLKRSAPLRGLEIRAIMDENLLIQMSKFIASNPPIEYLHLLTNHKDGRSDTFHCTKGLFQNRNLRAWSVSMTDADIKTFLKVLEQGSNLEYINLSGCIEEEYLESIESILRKHPNRVSAIYISIEQERKEEFIAKWQKRPPFVLDGYFPKFETFASIPCKLPPIVQKVV